MPTKPAVYRLVIFEAIEEPQALRDLICQVTGMHPTDVVQWLARAPGTWPQPLEEAAVRRLLDGLYDAQIAAEAWRTDQFPDLSPPRTIHRGACLGEGLRVEGLRGEPTHWIPWGSVELICAGRILSEDEFRNVQNIRWPSTVMAGIRALALMKPRPVKRLSRAARIARDPVNEVVIVRRDPRIAFRVVENQMNYSYLGERLKTSSADNFPVFLADLCARAEAAYITPSTHSLLEHRMPREHDFPSSQALLDYATHRLLWSWYSRDRESQAGSSGWDQPPDVGPGTDSDGVAGTDLDPETP
jgi:hypothetical protein